LIIQLPLRIFEKKCFSKTKDPTALSLKRACRVCRFEISEYLEKNTDVTTFLYRKSTVDEKERIKNILFIGGEHLATRDELLIFIKVYKELDDLNQTNFSNSLIRLLTSKYGIT